MSIMGVLRWVTTIALVISCSSGSFARGFCNADHVGDDNQREHVEEAAKFFYAGVGTMMDMMIAIEDRLYSDAVTLSGKASGLFQESVGRYKESESAYAKVSLGDFDVSAVEKLALSTPEIVFTVINDELERGPVSLLAYCGEQAQHMQDVTQKFGSILSERRENITTQSISRLLNEVALTLSRGRVVSAIFAASSGEMP